MYSNTKLTCACAFTGIRTRRWLSLSVSKINPGVPIPVSADDVGVCRFPLSSGRAIRRERVSPDGICCAANKSWTGFGAGKRTGYWRVGGWTATLSFELWN